MTDTTHEAPARICSIGGCGKRHKAKGFCVMHYYRLMRNGDAKVAKKAANGECINFLQNMKASQDCIDWPFGKFSDGYGSIHFEGKTMRASRASALLHHGKPESQKMEAAHSCGNRLCVNPKHIRWATRLENENDKIGHGTRSVGEKHGAAKLTEDDVRMIRQLIKTQTAASLCRKFNMSRGAIDHILKGKNWSCVI
jgi:hypothetical protein